MELSALESDSALVMDPFKSIGIKAGEPTLQKTKELQQLEERVSTIVLRHNRSEKQKAPDTAP